MCHIDNTTTTITTTSIVSEDDYFWARDVSKRSGKEYDAGMQEERSSDEEVDGGNTHNVRDEPGGAEGCGGGSGLMEKTDRDGH